MTVPFKKQRNTQKELDYETKRAVYQFRTPREIEKHAAKVYTSTLFFEVQKEIFKGAWFCSYSNAEKENGSEVYKVQHNNKNYDFKNEFKVIIYDLVLHILIILRYLIICVFM